MNKKYAFSAALKRQSRNDPALQVQGLLMDATYWGWKFGVVVFKDARTGKILWREFISRRETLADYQEGVDWLLANGFRIEASKELLSNC